MNKVTRKQITLGARRKDRPKKRRRFFNGQNTETDDSSFKRTSAKKLKGDDREHVPEEYTLQYSIIDFALVFSTLSSFVRCSNIIKNEDEDQLCNGKVQFKQCSKFGLGFKIVVECETREARIRHRQEQKDALDIATAAGSLLYGPGIDDSL